jgi:tocopherol O-methyltransferase
MRNSAASRIRSKPDDVGAKQPDDALGAIAAYYDEAWVDYRGAWMNKRNRAMHFGYWDSQVRTHASSLARSNEVMADEARVQPSDRVLDAGCGVGGSGLFLASRYGTEVVGITLSEDQVARGGRYAAEQGLSHLVTFRRQDFCATDFEDGSFDVVWAQESVCHAADKADFLREAHRLLRPGGRLVVRDWFRVDRTLGEEEEHLMGSWLSGFAIDDLVTVPAFTAAAEASGFVDVAARDITANARRSLRRLHLISRLFRPATWPLHRLGLRSELQEGNARAARDQWRAHRRGLWTVHLVSGRRP